MLVLAIAIQVAANPLGDVLKLDWGASRAQVQAAVGPSLRQDGKRKGIDGLSYGGTQILNVGGQAAELSYYFTPVSDKLAAAAIDFPNPKPACGLLKAEFDASYGRGIDMALGTQLYRFGYHRMQYHNARAQASYELIYRGEPENAEVCGVIMRPFLGLENVRRR